MPWHARWAARRCHDPEGGLTRDRAHLPAGVFDSISSSGLHALASAAAAAEGWLDRDMVAGEIRRTTRALLGIPKAAGFFPHFTRNDANGQPVVHPGTEYSTVDTAIALISLRLAGDVPGIRGFEPNAEPLGDARRVAKERFSRRGIPRQLAGQCS